MNIYTLHKQGSFRPKKEREIPRPKPLSSTCYEISNSHLTKKKPFLDRLDDILNRNSGHCSKTEETSSSRNTTAHACLEYPYHNSFHSSDYQEQQRRNSMPNQHQSQPSLTKEERRKSYIELQANDRFMTFEDHTDCVSLVTTPRAIRSSPLEDDLLLIDHEESDEDDLVSALTIPKALRKKKRKSKKR